jgi:transposase-like protein
MIENMKIVAREKPAEPVNFMGLTMELEGEGRFCSDYAHGMASAKSAVGRINRTLMPNKNNRPRRYQQNFKQAAADFVERNGRDIEHSATELGVDPVELRDWTRKLNVRRKPVKPLSGIARLRAENEALRNQVLQLQVQWDILKTTLGVLSTTVCSQEAA